MMKSTIVAYPGSFDPVTFGHLSLIEKAAGLFEKVFVVVAVSRNKNSGLFSVEERVEILQEVCERWNNVFVSRYDGLIVDFASKYKVDALIRGLRSGADYTYEMAMAQMNRHLGSGLETFFLPTDPAYFHVSSSLVKEVAALGGDLSGLCPSTVCEKIAEKISE